MRLIDADKLKEDIKEIGCDRFESWDKLLTLAEYETFVGDVIDNAPTVPLSDFKEGYKQAILDGKTNFSRPHGEWINQYIGGNECVMCSKCKLHFDIGTNYCPNCGADMREDSEA